MECLLIYLDTEHLHKAVNGKKKDKNEATSHIAYVHSYHVPLSESYYGLQNVTTLLLWFNKIIMKDNIFMYFFSQYELGNVEVCMGWITPRPGRT